MCFAGSCQLELSSSFLGGSVCPNQHVAFYCNASGTLNDFIWSLNDVAIHVYVSSAKEFIQHNQMTATFSVLLRNITSAQSHESELIFTSLPSGSTFKVTCSLGREAVTLTTKILGKLVWPMGFVVWNAITLLIFLYSIRTRLESINKF